MRNKIITCALLLSTLHAVAQNDLKLDDLRTPGAPGFILLDKAPASIEKPTTPKGFAISILSLRESGALEVSPYWLSNHPNLSFDDYVGNKFPILQNLSLSISSNRSDTLTTLSAGFRTHILSLHSKNSKKALDKTKVEITDLLNELGINPAKKDEILKKIAEKRKQLKGEMKPNILVELAGAILGSSNESSFESLKKSRTGIWLNANFAIAKKLDFIVLTRLIQNPYFSGFEKDTELVDVGSKFLFTQNKFSSSLEFIYRNDLTNNDNYNRFTGLVEYELSENIYLTATLGKNFTETDNIIALFGVNFGLSSNPNVKLQ